MRLSRCGTRGSRAARHARCGLYSLNVGTVMLLRDFVEDRPPRQVEAGRPPHLVAVCKLASKPAIKSKVFHTLAPGPLIERGPK